MSAPDKIWIDTFCKNDRAPDWPTKPVWAATEYVRADLSQAALTAAYEAAALRCREVGGDWATLNEKLGYKADCGDECSEAVLELITDPQRDALAAHTAAARAKGADEIAQLKQDLDDMRDNAESAYRRGYFAGGNGA